MPQPAFLPLDRVLHKRKDGAWDPGTVTRVEIEVLADSRDQAPEVFTLYRVELDRPTRTKAIVCGGEDLAPHPEARPLLVLEPDGFVHSL